MRTNWIVWLAAISLCTLPCRAADISWSAAFEIETDADIDVENEIVRAINVANPDAVDVIEVEFPNGKTVEFEPEHTFEFNDELDEEFFSGGNVTDQGAFYSGQDAALTTDNEDLDLIMDSHGWAGGGPGAAIAVLELTDLTVGTNYQIQLVAAADDRGCCEYRQTQIVDSNLDPINSSDGEELWFGRSNDFDQDDERGPGSVIGTFTADAQEQLINIMGTDEFDDGNDGFGNGNDPGLSMYVLSLAPSGVEGDFNGNGVRDTGDLDLLAMAMSGGDLAFDLNSDGATDLSDRTLWVETLANTFMGDSNYDGQFNSSDFVTVFGAAKYETGEAATWEQGDWNGDGLFNSTDFVAAFAGGGYEQGERDGGLQTVPEPVGGTMCLLASLGLLLMTRRQK